jgi:hypothetical protein
MGTNYYLKYKSHSVHIGKSCMGWKFQLNFTEILKFALECGEFEWFKGAIQNTLDNLKQLVRLHDCWYWSRKDPNANNSESIFTIHTIGSDLIDKIFLLNGVEIWTENDDKVEVKDFLLRLKTETNKWISPISLDMYSGVPYSEFS